MAIRTITADDLVPIWEAVKKVTDKYGAHPWHIVTLMVPPYLNQLVGTWQFCEQPSRHESRKELYDQRFRQGNEFSHCRVSRK